MSINKKGKMKRHYDYIGMEDFEDQLYDEPSHALLRGWGGGRRYFKYPSNSLYN